MCCGIKATGETPLRVIRTKEHWLVKVNNFLGAGIYKECS